MQEIAMKKSHIIKSIRYLASIMILCASFHSVSACSVQGAMPTVSDMKIHPEEYAGRQLTINACLLSSRQDIGLTDCRNASLVLSVYPTKNIEESDEWTNFRAYAYTGWNLQSKDTPNARLSGKLMLNNETNNYVFLCRRRHIHEPRTLCIHRKKTVKQAEKA
jgi:hypothetical protein